MANREPRNQMQTRRAQPYERASPKAEPEEDPTPDFETPSNSMKVSAATDVRALASTIVSACRDQVDLPALLTIGNASINQAVKGMAVARADIRHEGVDLAFQPAFRHVNRTRPLIAFYLSKQRVARDTYMGEEVELTVAAGSKIVAVAGAIAGKVREGKKVHMIAIGVDAVTNAVLASGNARLFLEKDNLDIKVQPEFTRIDKNGQLMNAIKFSFIPESI